MKPFTQAIACACLLGLAGTAMAHARLLTSEPAASSAVPAPAALKLHYNEAVEAAMSKLRLTGPGGATVELGKPSVPEGDPKTLVCTLPTLPAGPYRLQWSTMGHDGHHTQGELRFTVK